MHCVIVADLAALVSQHGPALVRGADEVPPAALARYWCESRRRADLWHQVMTRYRSACQCGDSAEIRRWWQDHLAVLEEVLVTEMLTRVLATLAAGLDETAAGQDEISPVAHSVFLSHLDASNRVHKLMLEGRGSRVQDVVRLNRLRSNVQHWTDALIGRMASQPRQPFPYAFEPQRARRFAVEVRDYGSQESRDMAALLINAAMHEALRQRSSPSTALPAANQAVAACVLMMFRPDRFDSVGALKSLWLQRLTSVSIQADRVIKELLAADIEGATTAEGLEMTGEPYFARWYL